MEELAQNSTIRKFRIVQKEGGREVARDIDHYNNDVIISVAYRVSSLRGTQFRVWATQKLKEYSTLRWRKDVVKKEIPPLSLPRAEPRGSE